MDSLLSSLPCELAFNQLRDACRRHSKMEKANGAALFSVCSKASMKHCFGAETLELSADDWAQSLQGRKEVKTQVHSAMRCTDVSLGISAEGLTRNRSSKQFTKPHIFAYRLQLLQALSKAFHDFEGADPDERRDHINALYSKMWVSKVVPELWFLRNKGDPDDGDNSLVVVRSGPFTLGCVLMVKCQDGNYKFQDDPYVLALPGDFDEREVAHMAPIVSTDGFLRWHRDGDWMGLADYIADVGIITMPASLFGLVCREMKLKTGKLDHINRCEFFLKHMGRSPDMIEKILEQVRANQKQRKQTKKKKAEDGEDEEDRLRLHVSTFSVGW